MLIVPPPPVSFHPIAHVCQAEPRLADLITPVAPVEPPAWWCNPSADYRISPKDAIELAEYEAWLDDQAVSADYDERAARVAEELDWTPAGADCLGFALGSIDSPNDPVYVADPDAGLMFADDPAVDASPAYW